jgi:hypothetical protein
MIIKQWLAVALTAVLISACGEKNDLDEWIGRWDGPEGTYLSIAKSKEGYALEIANLDGPRTFEATSNGEQLQFERDGQVQSIRATNGVQTGMKWLLDKTDCLTINVGEGFCRD